MDGLSSVSGTAMDIASNGASSIATSVLKGTEQLVADEVARLFATIGLGTQFHASA